MLKAIIQLMAAAQVGRNVKYYTFREPNLKENLENIFKFFCDKKILICQVYKALLAFCRVVRGKRITNDTSLDSQKLQEKCESFARKKNPDVMGFLIYFFNLPQNNPEASQEPDASLNELGEEINEEEDTPTQELSHTEEEETLESASNEFKVSPTVEVDDEGDVEKQSSPDPIQLGIPIIEEPAEPTTQLQEL